MPTTKSLTGGLIEGVSTQYSMETHRTGAQFYSTHTNGINHAVNGRRSWAGIPTRSSTANKAMCNVEIVTLK